MPSLPRKNPLFRFLGEPQVALTEFSLADWELLLRTARRSNLLSRVACIADRTGRCDRLPLKIRNHLQSALRIAESSQRSVIWEVRQVQKALSAQRIPFVLLKGAAYIACGLSPAPGRLLSDVDIMVPRDRLKAAEMALIEHGWLSTKIDAYDQRYYRQWMHELPPLQHLGRGTTLDVHHTILPPTSLLKPDVNKLWEQISPLPSFDGASVLSRADMVLHSATHLFHDGELENGLRDLVDIDALLREFSGDDDFWEHLLSRAIELDLTRPLYYALRYCGILLDTPIPLTASQRALRVGAPHVLLVPVMDVLILRSIGAVLDNKAGMLTAIAQFAMYVRSHYLRMPFHLLVPHLFRKQFVSAHR